MTIPARRTLALVLLFAATIPAFASAYNARPKLVVIIVVDQFRADLLERFRDQYGPSGFRTLLDRGAVFADCSYNYVNTDTAAGHATLGTGTYTTGHGILRDYWYDAARGKQVSSVEDAATTLVGAPKATIGESPHNLLATTIGDELKLATGGKARVFGVSFKDRAAILPVGFSANAAYWIDKPTGLWVTSSYYMKELPAWVTAFNREGHNQKYLNQQWKDAKGNVLRTTAPGQTWSNGVPLDYYDTVGRTPLSNDYTLEFTRALFENEKLGSGPDTDLLVVSFSSYDILEHRVGPDSPQMAQMTLDLDRQLSEFFAYLGQQVGLANVWIALSADHGAAPIPEEAAKLRIPAVTVDVSTLVAEVNSALSAKFSAHADYVKSMEWPVVFLSQDAFHAVKVGEEEAERAVAEAINGKVPKLRGYVTRAQMAQGNLPPGDVGRKFANSYSPYGGWYVTMLPPPYMYGSSEARYLSGTSHQSLFSYDTHVPLVFLGLPFRPGVYRTHSEPIDLATTLSSLLGINPPSSATGRVLTEALQPAAADVGPAPR
jgi:predicted AlkP superfamily pyrophosphatase or phosphodiesterase